MRRNLCRGLVVVAVVALLAGCASPPIAVNYSPSSILLAEGSVEVGSFRYLPGESGRVKPNQIMNTALGSVLFEKEIGELFREAVLKELRFVGVKIQSDKRVLQGEIVEFLMDDLGFSIDWTLEVRYRVTTVGSGAVIYESWKKLEKKTDKFNNIFGILNEIIKLTIEQLISDPGFTAAIK
jgi:uncharacterized lipoprotein